MKLPRLVRVTKSDIALGKPGIPSNCPVAIAINRKLKNGQKASVLSDTFKIYDREHKTVRSNIKLPGRVYTFVKRFDHLLIVKPMSFWVWL